MARKILIIDDEAAIRSTLSGVLRDESFIVDCAGSGEEGLGLVANNQYDAVMLDVWMPGIDGLETLRRIRQLQPDQIVIVMSGHGNIETAVKATKLGAFDFAEKPLALEKLLITLRNAFTFQELNQENQLLREQVERSPKILGNSKVILELREQIAKIAPLNSWVLITGENGTGKELVARSIHVGSKRAERPFIAVNCAAIPEELIESELFGHEKGAFTGAVGMKKGKFDLAHGGTIFLDEIADMSLKTQAKVLRILQEKKFERVGGSQTIEVDVRVIAATNKNLVEAIKQNQFREDLYYRLRVIPIIAPALRERIEDLPILLKHYFEVFAREQGREPKRLLPEALQLLKQYPWPGNVRELKNLAERLSIMGRSQEISLEDLPVEIIEAVPAQNLTIEASPQGGEYANLGLKEAKTKFERDYILHWLKANDWNISRTAQALAMERAHLHKKLKALKINEAKE